MQVNDSSRYIDDKNGNKYLVFDSTDENKELLTEKMITEKVTWKLNWTMTMTCH